MEKKLYWLVENNFDLSCTVPDLATIKDLIDGDMDFLEEDKKDAKYTLTPVWMTERKYASLPEA